MSATETYSPPEAEKFVRGIGDDHRGESLGGREIHKTLWPGQSWFVIIVQRMANKHPEGHR